MVFETYSDSYLKQFSWTYDIILQSGKFQNPIKESTEKKRGRKKKGKIRSLIDRLEEYKASVCLFVNDFSVPFHNNQAERNIRMIKKKPKYQAVSGVRQAQKII